MAEWRANKPTADAAPHGSMVRRHSSKWDDQLAAARATSGTPFRHTQASRAAAAVPLTSEEARQQVQVEGLTLRVSESKAGYFGVSLPIPGQPKPYQAVLRNLNRVSIQYVNEKNRAPSPSPSRGGECCMVHAVGASVYRYDLNHTPMCVITPREYYYLRRRPLHRHRAPPPLTSEQVGPGVHAYRLSLASACTTHATRASGGSWSSRRS